MAVEAGKGEQKRTDYCGVARLNHVGNKVTVAGWVQRRRNLGNLIFLDLRDRTGLLQLAFDDGTPEPVRQVAQDCRSEYVLLATGTLRERESKNPDMPTGEVELFVEHMQILAKSKVPPFEVLDDVNVNEELRLTYRYLDLRRPQMQHAMMMRHKITKATRDFFDKQGFLEVETPMLIRSTPEGARDYLVPSRLHQGAFYALPQSPQLYKQLLMLSGMDRYMQIARCFRDEDLRADRQPEFTQIDLEMSFVDREDVMELGEQFMTYLFDQVLGVRLKTPFRRLSYQDAMRRFGSDKPDTRFGLELVDLTELLTQTEFQVFRGAVETGSVRGINVKGAAQALSRKEIDRLVGFVKQHGGKGLSFTRWTTEAVSSSYEKFLSKTEVAAVRESLQAQEGDLLLLAADPSNSVVLETLGALRCHLAKKLDLIKEPFDLLWVTEFPLLEYSEEEERYVAKHHPFTAVMDEDEALLESNPGKCRAKAYDLILNGNEIGGGSIRIHDNDLQKRTLQALGFSAQEAKERFGFLLEAFSYGAPPHGGMAYGLDRLVMLMLGKESIRDVIAFPKVQSAAELMTNAPASVDTKQLNELHIQKAE